MPELSLWLLLAALVGGLLALDLLVFHRQAHAVSLREAALWSFVWIALGLSFGAAVWAWRGPVAGGEYLAGYAIEKALSMDNVFLFAMIFGYFAVPAEYQHRLLFWGVLGAIAFRAVFIAAGATLLEAFHWTIYIFGFVLLVTGWRMARSNGHGIDPQRNPVLRALRRLIPVSDAYSGQRFFVLQSGRLIATPLLAVLVVIETSDILFAIDSIPAIFAITTDPFIVFSSNAFAILGLRSLYFLLAGLVDRFVYLKVGLSALLVFAGVKILTSDLLKIPVEVSLGAIVAILGVTIAASMWKTRGQRRDKAQILRQSGLATVDATVGAPGGSLHRERND
jgi:tellurite resistance protein TerC